MLAQVLKLIDRPATVSLPPLLMLLGGFLLGLAIGIVLIRLGNSIVAKPKQTATRSNYVRQR